MDAKERAKKLLGDMNTIYLATNGESGYPDVRAVSVTKSDGLAAVWMLTGVLEEGMESKLAEVAKNPKCMIYTTAMEDDENYVELRLCGTAEILQDSESRDAVWHDVYYRYFPKGKDDPNLRVLKFTTSSARIQTESVRETVLFGQGKTV